MLVEHTDFFECTGQESNPGIIEVGYPVEPHHVGEEPEFPFSAFIPYNPEHGRIDGPGAYVYHEKAIPGLGVELRGHKKSIDLGGQFRDDIKNDLTRIRRALRLILFFPLDLFADSQDQIP